MTSMTFEPVPPKGTADVDANGTVITFTPEATDPRDPPGTCIQFFNQDLPTPGYAPVKNICNECRRMKMQWNGQPYPIEYELAANAVGQIQMLGNGGQILNDYKC